MLNIFSLKQARAGDAVSNEAGTKKRSPALLRVTTGYLLSI